jgi:hypothetical protein
MNRTQETALFYLTLFKKIGNMFLKNGGFSSIISLLFLELNQIQRMFLIDSIMTNRVRKLKKIKKRNLKKMVDAPRYLLIVK